jgi:hypothetical protein
MVLHSSPRRLPSPTGNTIAFHPSNYPTSTFPLRAVWPCPGSTRGISERLSLQHLLGERRINDEYPFCDWMIRSCLLHLTVVLRETRTQSCGPFNRLGEM